jgi:hypothetical protein
LISILPPTLLPPSKQGPPFVRLLKPFFDSTDPQRSFRRISWLDYEGRFHVRMEAAIIVDGTGLLQN